MTADDRATGALLARVQPGGVVVADVTVRTQRGASPSTGSVSPLGIRERVITIAATRTDNPAGPWKITGAHRPYTTGDLLMMSSEWIVLREERGS